MARPEKQWLDYFSFDVFVDNDTKIQILEIETWLEWFAIFVKLLCHIYNNWYYCERDDRKQKLFARNKLMDIAKLSKVIDVCLIEWIFNKEIYEKYKILTSKWIQKRLIAWIWRRKSYTFIEQYLLITKEYINENIWKVNVYINSINDDINSINDDISTQSKVKESKVKESKDNIITTKEQVKNLLDEEYIQTYSKPLKAMMVMIEMGLVVKENKKDVADFVDWFKEKAKIYNYILPNWNYDFDWMIQRVDRWKTYHQDNKTVIEKYKSSVLQFLDSSRDKRWKQKK